MNFKHIIASALVLSLALGTLAQQTPQGKNDSSGMLSKMKEEESVYYAGTDTARYGVRYKMKYLFNKENNLTFKEDRMVLVTPDVSLDMSYEGIGEMRWRAAYPDSKSGDPSLSWRLTPSFYFYFPEDNRQVETYRIMSDEFLLRDTVCANNWTVTTDERTIGQYKCRKATLDKGGRHWTAWFTTDLPYKAAPRDFNGLPGVVLDLCDADGEIAWRFNGLVENLPDSKLYVKFPDRFSKIDPKYFPKIVRIYSLSDNNYIQRSGVADRQKGFYPEQYRPAMGLDACLIDNPIDKD